MELCVDDGVSIVLLTKSFTGALGERTTQEEKITKKKNFWVAIVRRLFPYFLENEKSTLLLTFLAYPLNYDL
jgi:hypothetical protein